MIHSTMSAALLVALLWFSVPSAVDARDIFQFPSGAPPRGRGPPTPPRGRDTYRRGPPTRQPTTAREQREPVATREEQQPTLPPERIRTQQRQPFEPRKNPAAPTRSPVQKVATTTTAVSTSECFTPRYWCGKSETQQQEIASLKQTNTNTNDNARTYPRPSPPVHGKGRMKPKKTPHKGHAVFGKSSYSRRSWGKSSMMRMPRRKMAVFGRRGKGGQNGKSGKSGKGSRRRHLRSLVDQEPQTNVRRTTKKHILSERQSDVHNLDEIKRQHRRTTVEDSTSDPSIRRDLGSSTRRSYGGKGSKSSSYWSGSRNFRGKGRMPMQKKYYGKGKGQLRPPAPPAPRKVPPPQDRASALDIFDFATDAYAVSVCRLDLATGQYQSVCVDVYDLDEMATEYQIYCGCCTTADEPGEKPDFCFQPRYANVSELPSSSPTESLQPSISIEPSSFPTGLPSHFPTSFPSLSASPSMEPTNAPTSSVSPSLQPTSAPSLSVQPSSLPSHTPSVSASPSSGPTNTPTVSSVPSLQPTGSPSLSFAPSVSSNPSSDATIAPTLSSAPSLQPTDSPSSQPSTQPTNTPSVSSQPSLTPSNVPSESQQPTVAESDNPTISQQPTSAPSSAPSSSMRPSSFPSDMPSISQQPSESQQPTSQPSPEFGELVLTIPEANITVNEDESADLSKLVDYVDRVPRDDEEIFIEVRDYPTGTKFFLGSEEMTTIRDGALLIPADNLSGLRLQPPQDFSGRFSFNVTATLRENGVVVVETTPPDRIQVEVLPVAEDIDTKPRVIAVEDQGGPLPVGAKISSELLLSDDGQSEGNNNETETLIEFRIDVPDNSEFFSYVIEGFFGGLTEPGPTKGNGTAEIFVEGSSPGAREFIIRSTLVPNGANSTDDELLKIPQTNRETATNDILATLALFEFSFGPNHTDLDGELTVTAVNADVNTAVSPENAVPGAVDIGETTWSPLLVQAIADTPSLAVVDPAGTIPEEDGATIPLSITATPSADLDNSEVLSVKITVPLQPIFFPFEQDTPIGEIRYNGEPPAGVSISMVDENAWLIEADGDTPENRADLLNSVLNGGNLVFDPRDGWAGNLVGEDGLQVDLISTEREGGFQVAPEEFGGDDMDSRRETVTAFIGLEVTPVADVPTVEVKGNAIGREDEINPVPIEVTLNDPDGSESFIMTIPAEDFPPGTRIFGQNGTELLAVGGIYTLAPEDAEAFALLPPLHYSSALSGNIEFEATAIVTDGDSTANFTLPVSVNIVGVADKPLTSTPVKIVTLEDKPYFLGETINVTNLLVDRDTSESISLRLEGLPPGVVPTSETGDISYIGNGNWNIGLDAIETLQIPPVTHYSGENPYPTLQLFAVVQELDGDEETSDPWDLEFEISPVVDGFSEWQTQTFLAQGAVGGISLDLALRYSFADNDGSEEAISVIYDLSSLIEDAGIGVKLDELPGEGTGLDKLVNNYLDGTFTYDPASGNITALVDDAPGLRLREELFEFSNQNFDIPVSVLVRDSAVIKNVTVTDEEFESTTIRFSITGIAEIPTVFAEDAIGESLSYIPVFLGGESTDGDALLGREPSESIYYIVSDVFATGMPFEYAFVNNITGEVVGQDRGSYYLLFPDDLENLAIYTPGNYNGVLNFTLTTVAVENDGDLANSEAIPFSVTFLPDSSSGAPPPPGETEIPPPIEPEIIIGNPTNGTGGSGNGTDPGENQEFNVGVEDGKVVLDIQASPGEGETTNPVVTVTISNVPPGFTVEGAIFNPVEGTWSVDAADISAGLVSITPPEDFSGFFNFTVEAVASTGLQTSTGEIVVTAYVDPVADGVNISFSPGSGTEGEEISASITLDFLDSFNSEGIQGDFVYFQIIGDKASLNYTIVTSGDSDASIDGEDLTGYYRIPLEDLADFKIDLEKYWHGPISGNIRVPVIELEDDEDGDNFILSKSGFTINIRAKADEALITVPSQIVVGNEDEAIPIPDLSAALADTNAENGGEVLSVVITGVPEDTRFNAGSQNGEGSWVFPVDALDTLTVTPPQHFSGTMNLTLEAFTFESSNGDETSVSKPFTVQVNPVPDSFLIVARDVDLDESPSGLGYLDLELRMIDDRGTDETGERLPEYVSFTFENVPEGVRFLPTLGGRLTTDGSGTFVFTGTPEQAGALNLITGPGTDAQVSKIDVSGVSIDGGVALVNPVRDQFQFTVDMNDETSVALSGPGPLVGSNGNDILSGDSGDNEIDGDLGADLIRGGGGSDLMTGGGGRDVFQWAPGDLDGSLDRITDFTMSEDILNLSDVFTSLGINYDPQTFDVNNFLKLRETIDGAEISLLDDTPVVLLEGVTGISLESLFAQGSILL